MKLKETCKCGASIEIEANSSCTLSGVQNEFVSRHRACYPIITSGHKGLNTKEITEMLKKQRPGKKEKL